MPLFKSKQSRGWWRWVRDLGLLTLVFFAVQWWQGKDLPLGPAPALAGSTVSGRSAVRSVAVNRPVDDMVRPEPGVAVRALLGSCIHRPSRLIKN